LDALRFQTWDSESHRRTGGRSDYPGSDLCAPPLDDGKACATLAV